MKAFAVISDIHGNLEALNAVLADIDAQGIETIVSLGDVVGYGPDPEACLRLVDKRCRLKLIGNHEHAVLHPKQRIRFNAAAQQALEWTRARTDTPELNAMMKRLGPEWQLDDLYFVHGTVRNPLHEYLRVEDQSGYSTFDEMAQSLERDFVDFRLCFIGHNHHPFLATTEGFIHPHAGQSRFHVGPEDKFYISVGSVGQPRDGDPRACYVTCDGASIAFHRVPYAHEVTAKKILAAGLPAMLAERLALGQ
jgi:diadenosine tetraphosphatase ApaH/serine/threonine PP2A family protein phosphatase